MQALRALALCGAVLLGNPCPAAEPLRMAASSSWAMPYAKFDADHFNGGIVYDLGQALEKALDMPVDFVVLPRKRIDGAVLAGEIDLRCYTNPQWTPIADQHIWSKSLFDLGDVLFGSNGTAEPANLKSLPAGSVVSTVLGYEYLPLQVQFASGQLKRDDAADLEKLLMKMSVGRSPYGIADALSLQWYQRTTPQHRLAPWRLSVSRNDFMCGVPKKGRVSAAKILAALDELKKTGRIDEILRKYR